MTSVKGELLLRSEPPQPGLQENFTAKVPSNPDGIVRTAGINNDNLFRKSDALQAFRKIVSLVLSDKRHSKVGRLQYIVSHYSGYSHFGLFAWVASLEQLLNLSVNSSHHLSNGQFLEAPTLLVSVTTLLSARDAGEVAVNDRMVRSPGRP